MKERNFFSYRSTEDIINHIKEGRKERKNEMTLNISFSMFNEQQAKRERERKKGWIGGDFR